MQSSKIYEKKLIDKFAEDLSTIKYPEFINRSTSVERLYMYDGSTLVDKEMDNISLFMLSYNKQANRFNKTEKYLSYKKILLDSFVKLMNKQVHYVEVLGRDASGGFSVLANILINMFGKNRAMKIIRAHARYERTHNLMDFISDYQVFDHSRCRTGKKLNAVMLMNMTKQEISEMSDEDFLTAVAGSKFLYYYKVFGYAQFNNIIQVCSNKGMDLHSILVNLPNSVNRRYISEDGFVSEEYKKEVAKLFKYASTLSRPKLTKVLQFLNYERIRNGYNESWRDKEIYMNNVIFARNYVNLKEISDIRYVQGNMSGIIDPYKYSDEIHFSKEKTDIITIGEKTGCCFHLGGMAKHLVIACLNSSIAGIIKGDYKGSPWFAFVWEIGIKNDEGIVETHLILDNIECLGRTIDEQFINDHIIPYIENNTKYNRAYLGTNYNKVSRSYTDQFSKILRPYRLSLQGKRFYNYFTHDDSYQLYPIYIRSEESRNKDIKLKKTRLTDVADIERAIYVLLADKHITDNDSDFNDTLLYNYDHEIIVNTDKDRLYFDTNEYSFIFTNKQNPDKVIKFAKAKEEQPKVDNKLLTVL